jgi:hypothetical protein
MLYVDVAVHSGSPSQLLKASQLLKTSQLIKTSQLLKTLFELSFLGYDSSGDFGGCVARGDLVRARHVD